MILVGNGKLITRNPHMPYIENGGVVTLRDKVLETGPFSVLREKYPEAVFIDAEGGIIMPGLINMHTHIYSAVAMGLYMEGNHPRNHAETIDGSWWSADRRLSPEGLKACAYSLILDCIRNGVTTCFINHASFAALPGSIFALKEVVEELGIRACLCYEVSERNGKRQCEKSIEENAELASWADRYGNGMLCSILGVHSLFSVSDTTLDMLVRSGEGNTGYHIHFANGGKEVADSITRHGCRPADRLLNAGMLGDRTLISGYYDMHPSEMDIIRDMETMAVDNPESDIENKKGCLTAEKMIHKGILVGMGTDMYAHDMLESLRTFTVLQKRESPDPTRVFGEGMKMLFENNRIMASRFFSMPLGVLEPGAPADIIVMDYKPYTPFSDENVNSHMQFGMNGRCCKTTIINGKLIYNNRKFITFDEEEINEKILTQSSKLWIRMNSREYL